jgi:preprotein translocase SecE subunit
VARDRKSSQRRRGSSQPARPRPKPAAGKPTPGTPGRSGDAATPPVVPDPPEQLGLPVDEAQPIGRPLGDTPIHVASPGDAAVVDESLLGDATVDEVFADDESVIAALEPADLPVGAVPTDPPLLPPIESTDGETAATSEFASTREHLAANRLDESDEILPAARRAGRPPAKVGGNKVTSFLRASWAELQRVQWPDRRQVGQATAVVLGFVAIAGGFLGLANLLGSDLVNALL